MNLLNVVHNFCKDTFSYYVLNASLYSNCKHEESMKDPQLADEF